MKFITMWKDYGREVLIPCWKWFKKYWIQYSVLTILMVGGVWFYYTYLYWRF